MVLLTLTEPMVVALDYIGNHSDTIQSQTEEPPLDKPAVGKPISHGQVLDLFECLQTIQRPEEASIDCPNYHLDELLRGSRVYIEPPKPKPEQVQSTASCLSLYRTTN